MERHIYANDVTVTGDVILLADGACVSHVWESHTDEYGRDRWEWCPVHVPSAAAVLGRGLSLLIRTEDT